MYKIVVEILQRFFFLGGGYFSGQKKKWKFQGGGGGAYVKFPPWGVWIFSGTTQCLNQLKILTIEVVWSIAF